MKAHPVVRAVTFDFRDRTFGEDAVLPLGFVRILDFLDIHVVVDCLNELEADHAVVGCLVRGKCALAFLRREVEECIHPFGIEYLIDTASVLSVT